MGKAPHAIMFHSSSARRKEKGDSIDLEHFYPVGGRENSTWRTQTVMFCSQDAQLFCFHRPQQWHQEHVEGGARDNKERKGGRYDLESVFFH